MHSTSRYYIVSHTVLAGDLPLVLASARLISTARTYATTFGKHNPGHAFHSLSDHPGAKRAVLDAIIR